MVGSAATPDQPEALPSWPPEGRLEGWPEVQAALRAFVLAACGQGCREMWWIAPDFDQWPLDDSEVLEALTQWARRPGVHLYCISHDFEPLRRSSPKWVRWRQTFGHVLSCKRPDETAGVDLPRAMLADRVCLLKVLDVVHPRARVTSDKRDIHYASEQIAAILQRSSDTFSASVLGL